jgi:putative CRISPR-associated protein (TIGR02620 family)
MLKVDLVITRHGGLIDFLVNRGLDLSLTEAVAHVTDPTILVGKTVVGVLPTHLAVLCETFVEVRLDIPAEMRGKELSAEQTEEYCKGIFAYHFGRNFIEIETL